MILAKSERINLAFKVKIVNEESVLDKITFTDGILYTGKEIKLRINKSLTLTYIIY